MKLLLKFMGPLLLFVSLAAMANDYNVVFTNSTSPGGTVVGTGTFDFTDSVGDGTYYINTLGGFTVNFTIGATTFTNADNVTELNHVEVVVYDSGTNFYFTNDGTYGPYGGSFDFTQGSSHLTTEPPYYGPPPLDLYQAVDSSGASFFGTYGAVGAPEPASMLLLLSGLVGVGLRKSR
jgi:hypothetical protein